MQSKFNLVVIQPRVDNKNVPAVDRCYWSAGKKYELVCELGIYADSVSSAIKRTRLDFQGSGCVVLQASQFHKSEEQAEVVAEEV